MWVRFTLVNCYYSLEYKQYNVRMYAQMHIICKPYVPIRMHVCMYICVRVTACVYAGIIFCNSILIVLLWASHKTLQLCALATLYKCTYLVQSNSQ